MRRGGREKHEQESRGELSRRGRRRSFTLIELLITVSIIAIMASMVLFAMFAAQQQARVQKTRSLVTKLSNIVRARYETYRTRRLPFPQVNDTFNDVDPSDGPGYKPGTDKLTYDANYNGQWDVYLPKTVAKMRLDMLRDYMRMEMPDRWSDVYDPPWVPVGNPYKQIPRPAANAAYYQKWQNVTGGTGRAAGAEANQGAECLYMIVMEAVAQDGDSRDVFKPDDVADTDGDGFPEFVDAWRTPIKFLRWVPGFISEVQNPVRGKIQNVNGSGRSVTITTQPPTVGQPSRFTSSPGEYLNGTLAVIDTTGGGEYLNTQRMGRITGYNYDSTSRIATFTFTTPSYTMQPAFVDQPQPNNDFVIMPPDPFDSRAVYPLYSNNSNPPSPDTSRPTYALYPLIYSAGPDKVYGITGDIEIDKSVTPAIPVRYASLTMSLNPFYVDAPNQNSTGLVFGLMVGTNGSPKNFSEPNFYIGAWNDNIHSHQLNMR